MTKFIFLIFIYSSVSFASDEFKVCENFRGTGLNEETVIKYQEKLLGIIKNKDFKKFAAELKYPFTLRVKSKKIKQKIASADELIAKYKEHFNLDYVAKGLKSEKKRIVCNFQGVGYLNGRVWVMAEQYHKNKDGLKIVAINGL